MCSLRQLLCVWGLCAGLACLCGAEPYWPQFRGPSGQGIVDDPQLPLKWSEKQNLAWKTLIPGAGWSSPVVGGNMAWVTTATEDHRSLRVLGVSLDTGKIAYNIEVFKLSVAGKIHARNRHATPTPVLEGDRIYVHFGAHGTACLTTSGKIVWQQKYDYYHHHGPASSPVLSGGRVILLCDGFTAPFYDKIKRGSSELGDQFILGLKPESGEIDWIVKRQKGEHSYCTPLAIDVAGQPQLICPGANRLVSLEPATGKELWSVGYTGYSVVPRPVYSAELGLIMFCTGYNSPELWAVRPDGTGDVTNSHVAWTFKQGVPTIPSPVIHGEHILFVNDVGILTCLEGTTGKQVFKRRLPGAYSASPIVAGDRVYFLCEDGTVQILDGSDEKYPKLAQNKLMGIYYASPAAPGGGRLLLRSDKTLYCVREHEPVPPEKLDASE